MAYQISLVCFDVVLSYMLNCPYSIMNTCRVYNMALQIRLVCFDVVLSVIHVVLSI